MTTVRLAEESRHARAFERAARTYHDASRLQAEAARRLADLWPLSDVLNIKAERSSPLRILEAGAGTGHLTTALVQKFLAARSALDLPSPTRLHLTVTDLSSAMLDEARRRLAATFGDALPPDLTFVPAAAEALSRIPEVREKAPYDLISAASVLQWVADPAALFRDWAELVRPGGYVLVSVFGPDNLTEIRELSGGGLPAPEPNAWGAILGPDYELVTLECDTIVEHYPTPRAVLAQLRATGVNGLPVQECGETAQTTDASGNTSAPYPARTLRTRAGLAAWEDAYRERFSDADGRVTLTWTPVRFLARRTGN
ncbi:methyltransferase [Sutterella megalosphaeroides]|uniref:Malonyl-[acyl-carrier protein] O-methyltransferase n=1 Tax=Sutterella megalosphaeroides TaxID=2494234 RepID=A0A2Z6IC80_9BURK|nr:methyltransferase [Sutterella megalosphaeroides]BBF23267.1 malonyl-[acyl-carrier protein] O-methyltransferase [Sutterella megalosphaeroides]